MQNLDTKYELALDKENVLERLIQLKNPDTMDGEIINQRISPEPTPSPSPESTPSPSPNIPADNTAGKSPKTNDSHNPFLWYSVFYPFSFRMFGTASL